MTASLDGMRKGSHDVAVSRVLGRTCAAEWSRLWTVRATWWFLAATAVAMVGIGAIAGLESAGGAEPADGDPAWSIPRFATMPVQFGLLALVLTAVTSDYATGGIVPALQWTPRRGVLFAARATVAVCVATSLGIVLGAGSALAAFLAARPALTLPAQEGVGALATVALVLASGAALAVGLGFLLRNAAGALVTVFLLMLVLPLLLPQFGYDWLTEFAQVLPGSGAAWLLIGGVPGMTQSSSVTVMLAWATGALLLGWLRLTRDDANR